MNSSEKLFCYWNGRLQKEAGNNAASIKAYINTCIGLFATKKEQFEICSSSKTYTVDEFLKLDIND